MGTNNGITRRSFVISAAAVAAAAALAAAGCTPKQNTVTDTDKTTPTPADQGTWVSAACWHNCGGRCLNKALVNDGVVIRQKTDDTHDDDIGWLQQRACVRGHSQRNQIFSADRIRKPLKRSSWTPGGGANSHGDMRGKDTWEEIEWDDALTQIATEIKRVKDADGNRAIFSAGSEGGRLLSLYGGYVGRWGTTSRGSFHYTPGPCGFFAFGYANGSNDRFDFLNCQYVVMIGINSGWSSAGEPLYYATYMKENGVKFIGVDPFYNESYAALDAEWIPCHPACDTALEIGIAYEMLRLDTTQGNIIDWDFLNKYTIGFDAEHMPDGEDPKGNFKDYLLGTYDGVPKDPDWTNKHSGIPADKVTYIAGLLAKDNKVAFLTSAALARNQQADNYPQILMTIGAMGGHYGKSGHMCGASYHTNAFNGGPQLFNSGSDGLPSIANPITEDCFCDAELWRGIYTGSYTWTGNAPTVRNPGVKKDIDIKIIWHSSGARLQTADDMNMGIKAHRKVDLVVSNASYMTTNSKYADFILPVTTLWERPGGFLTGNREMIIMHTQVVDRFYESYSDQEIVNMLAPKLGIDPTAVYPFDETQQFFNQCVGATMVGTDGKNAPLISFTQAEIDALGVQGSPQDGFISFTDLKASGVVTAKRSAGDSYNYIEATKFVSDPVKNPTQSESGLMEIYSRKLASNIAEFGYTTDVTPIPTVYYGPEGLAGTFANGDVDAGVPSAYPYQMYNPHYMRRSHSVFDNVQWLREAWTNPVYINSLDAAAKGVQTGDTVKVTSPHGATLRTACVTARFAKGVVGMPHGAWPNVDETNGLDHSGCDNYLSGTNCYGAGVSGWNSQICNFEKYSTALTPDVQLPLLVTYDDNGTYTGGGRM